MKSRPAPIGWNKTITDLMAEIKAGVRAGMSGEEADWARDYERSLLPEGTRFPKEGDIYEVLEDMDATFLTSWSAPFTGSGTGHIRKGERFIAKDSPSQEKPIAVYLEAVDYSALEQRLVKEEDRTHEHYSGFYFCFKTADLNQKFRLI